jgi:hypothetical protein
MLSLPADCLRLLFSSLDLYELPILSLTCISLHQTLSAPEWRSKLPPLKVIPHKYNLTSQLLTSFSFLMELPLSHLKESQVSYFEDSRSPAPPTGEQIDGFFSCLKESPKKGDYPINILLENTKIVCCHSVSSLDFKLVNSRLEIDNFVLLGSHVDDDEVPVLSLEAALMKRRQYQTIYGNKYRFEPGGEVPSIVQSGQCFSCLSKFIILCTQSRYWSMKDWATKRAQHHFSIPEELDLLPSVVPPGKTTEEVYVLQRCLAPRSSQAFSFLACLIWPNLIFDRQAEDGSFWYELVAIFREGPTPNSEDLDHQHDGIYLKEPNPYFGKPRWMFLNEHGALSVRVQIVHPVVDC